MADDPWDLAADAFIAKKQNRAAVNTVQARDPDAVARAQWVAKYTRSPPALVEAQLPVFTKDANLQHNRETIAQYPWMTGFLGDADAAATVPQGELSKVGNIVDTLGKRPKSAPQHPTLADPRLTQSSYFGKKTDTPVPQMTGIFDTDIGQPKSRSYEGPRVQRYSDGTAVQGVPEGGVAYTGNQLIDTGSRARHIFSNSVGGLASALGGAIEYGIDTAGGAQQSELGDVAKDLNRAGDFLRSYYRPKAQAGWVGKAEDYALDASSMVFDIATAAGILKLGKVKNTAEGIARFYGITTGAEAYGKYRERGGTADEALGGAAIEGAAEYAGEKLVAPLLVAAFGEKAVKGLIKEYIFKDLLGEELTTVAQYSADQLIANPDGNWNVKDLGMQLLDTAAVTLLGGGMIGAASRAQMSPVLRAAREAQDAMAAVESHAILESTMAQAEKSTMRANAPEQFAQFVQQGAETGTIREVYVPVEAIDAVLADETTTEEERAVLTLYQSAIDEARPGNNEIVIPVGEFASKFTGTLYQKLADEVRTTPGGMSAKEAREFQDVKVAELEKLDAVDTGTEADVAAAEVQRSSKQQVYDTVKEQMLDAGRPAREAETSALLAASRAEKLATTRYGQFSDAMAAHKAVGFAVAPKGAKKGKGAKRTVNQPDALPAPTQLNKPRLPTESEMRRFGRVESVPLSQARAGQNIMDWEGQAQGNFAAPLLDGFADMPVAVRMENGEYIIYDGNHRTTRALKAGETALDMHVIDGRTFDPENAGRKPAPPASRAEIDALLAALGSEDVFSSTTGDGTGTDTEGTRTVYQGTRGQTQWFADGSTVVTLFAEANFSTMLHEMSHVFLEQEFRLAQNDGASPELKADVESIKAWMAANGHPVGADGAIPVGAHELWARTGEAYFRKGEAPSAELRGAFATFKKFLTDIYASLKALRAYGPVKLNPTISEIFDRIIATDTAIAANATTPMSREDMGITQPQYDAYLAANEKMVEAAREDLLDKSLRSIRRREQKKVAEQRRNLRKQLLDEFNAQPVNIALHMLRTGTWLGQPEREGQQIKLHAKWLTDNYGPDILERLPQGPKKIYSDTPGGGREGAALDIWAQSIGMNSADALVDALVGLKAQADVLNTNTGQEYRDALVSQAVDQAMEYEYGDLGMSEAAMREEAIASLNSEQHGALLSEEFRYLARRAGVSGQLTPYEILKRWAKDKIAAGKVSEVASKAALQRFIRGYNRARTALEKALLAGDPQEAARQKKIQLIQHAQLSEGKRAADEVNKIVARLKKLGARKEPGSIDPDYMDRINELLEGYSFTTVSAPRLAERDSFEQWAEKQRANNFEVHAPPRIAKLLGIQNYAEVTVAELRELDATVASLQHLGRTKQRLVIAGKEREINEVKNEMRQRILDNNPERNQGDTSIGEDFKPFAQGIGEAWAEKDIMEAGRAVHRLLAEPVANMREAISTFVKIERLTNAMDGTTDTTGPAHQLLIQRSHECADTVADLHDEVMEPLAEVLQNMPGKWRSRLNYLVNIPELTLEVSIDKDDQKNLGKPMRVTRRKLATMLLNTGSLSNLQKMVEGEKWINPATGVAYNFESMRDLDALRTLLWSKASAEDLQFVNAVWEGVGKLWPHIERVERKMSGVSPEKIEALAFVTPHGNATGGYWPVVWDSARSQMGQDQADVSEGKMFGIGAQVGTQAGHIVTRTGAAAPMELNFERILTQHLNRVISRIAYAEWVRDVLRIENSRRVTGALNLRLGAEYTARLKPWIRDQIPSSSITPDDARLVDKALNEVRLTTSGVILGSSYMTLIAQGIGYANAMGEIGTRWTAKGVYIALKHAGGKIGSGLNKPGPVDFVFARSAMMNRRMHENNPETADAFRQLSDNSTKFAWVRARYFWLIAYAELHLVAVPIWLGAYGKSMSEGKSEAQAAKYADSVVRLTQGGGRDTDLAAVQRGSPTKKLFVAFYTPGSVLFNQLWATAREFKKADTGAKYAIAVKPVVAYLALQAILDGFRTDDFPDEDEDEDGRFDEIALWAMRRIGFTAASSVPLLREVSNPLERKIRGEYSEFGSTLIATAIEGTAEGVTTAMDLFEDTNPNGEDTPMTGKQFKKLAFTGGLLLRGAPGLQVGKSGGFLFDEAQGAVNPESAYDWYHGLSYGKMPEKEEAQ